MAFRQMCRTWMRVSLPIAVVCGCSSSTDRVKPSEAAQTRRSALPGMAASTGGVAHPTSSAHPVGGGDGQGGQSSSPKTESTPLPCANTHIAFIGDFGLDGPGEAAVAGLINTFQPDAVITTGDNNYPSGQASTIDANIGKYFSTYIHPYLGIYGPGATQNRFFPSLGNHDFYTADAQPYLDYFALPGNERYYDYVLCAVHFFVIDSEPSEPDGITSNSAQAQWLMRRLSSSTSSWNVVYFHEAPYSSGAVHGSNTSLRWPFREWGADLVLNGHNHIYERVEVDGMYYVTNGLGGGPIQPIGDPVAGSIVRYNDSNGAGFIDANATTLIVRFLAIDYSQVDQFVLSHD
jgi:tartrate-resistant acid phosphatase type 5